MSKFNITNGKGFHITFANGWTVSVQFGPGNYCDNYNLDIGTEATKAGQDGSNTAECAVWNNVDGDLHAHEMFDGDSVGGYMTSDKVLELLNWAASQPKEKEASNG